ncbi:hypothetical protein FH972_019768 [Carpinus fangiana]|uniref:Uncharacterized protein n=1 Tax=Carpinus fangiana TaxID=176857 RepID=A0A5N6RTD9_9ROSI|nr:hypothetical protein FH972_019768 [Carpinus fangiana]
MCGLERRGNWRASGLARVPGDTGLQGVIESTGILCVCGKCKGGVFMLAKLLVSSLVLAAIARFSIVVDLDASIGHNFSRNFGPCTIILCYQARVPGDTVPQGVIESRGILCFGGKCRGVEKENILCNVMNACSELQRYLGYLARHLPETDNGNLLLLCKSCVECLKDSQASLAQTADANDGWREGVGLGTNKDIQWIIIAIVINFQAFASFEKFLPDHLPKANNGNSIPLCKSSVDLKESQIAGAGVKGVPIYSTSHNRMAEDCSRQTDMD